MKWGWVIVSSCLIIPSDGFGQEQEVAEPDQERVPASSAEEKDGEKSDEKDQDDGNDGGDQVSETEARKESGSAPPEVPEEALADSAGPEVGPTRRMVDLSPVDFWPRLPVWSSEDVGKLKRGEIVPGAGLLLELPEEFVLPPDPEPEPTPVPRTPLEDLLPPPDPEDLVEEDPTVVQARFLEPYFGQRPANFLVDPQEMLSRQQYRDREKFLEYHAGDSEVNLYIYLFDTEQQLPTEFTIEGVFEEHFARSGSTALVFYYLGAPERSEMVLSEDIRAVVSQEKQDRARHTAIQEALEKSDFCYQLDNFSVELSIRLYWFEKEMGSPGRVEPGGEDLLARQEGVPAAGLPRTESKAMRYLGNAVWGVLLLAMAAVLVWVGRVVARRRLRYVFPEVEVEPLLGAPHAAGVGAVISFASAQLPPSQQRDQVPDYLQRM